MAVQAHLGERKRLSAEVTIGQFVAERVLTAQTEEGIDDYEAWLVAAKQAAAAHTLLPE